MRQSVRLAIAFFILSTLPVAFVSYVSIVNAERSVERELENHLLAITEMREADFDRWVNSLERIIESIGQRPAVFDLSANLVAQANRETRADPAVAAQLVNSHLLPHLRAEGLFEAFSIVDAETGRVLVSTEEDQVGNFRIGEAYYEGALTGTFVGKVRFAPSLEGLALRVSTPIREAGESAVAILVGRADLRALDEIITFAYDIHETEDVYLVNRFRFFVTEPRFGEGYALQRLALTNGVERALAGDAGVAAYVDYRGVLVLGAYRWLPDYGMALIAEIDHEEAFGPIQQARTLGIGLMVGAIVAFTSLGFLLARTMTHPLRRIAAGAAKIGRGEFGHRIGSTRTDEFGDLARVFDRMAENLQEITASRDDLHREMAARREAEEALRESEAEFRMLSEASPVGVCILQDDLFRYVNPSFERIFGYRADELIDRVNPLDLVHMDDREKATRYMRESSEHLGEKPPLLFQGLRRDGSVVPCEGFARPIDYEGSPAILGAITDTTLRGQAEERFRLAAEVASDLIYEWDVLTDELHWFGDIDSALGYPPGTIPHMIEGWIDLIHPEDQQRLAGSVDRHRVATVPIYEEYRVRAKDGSWRYWIDRGMPVLLGSDRPRRWVGVCIDDTERMQAVADLQESERRYRNIVELAPVGIVTVNLAGIVESCNEEFARIIGFSRDAMVGVHFTKLPSVRSRDVPSYVRMFAAVLRGRTPDAFEATWTGADGAARKGEIRVAALRRESRPWGIQVIVQDITERDRAAEELRENEAKYRELVEEIHEVIYTIDETGIITYLSPSVERLGGYTPEELIGKPYRDLGFGDDLPSIEEMKRIVERTTDLQPAEYRLVTKDGSIRWMRTAARPIMVGERFAGLRGVLIDVTEAKNSEQALRISEEQHRSLFENAALGIYQTAPDGKILAANPALVRMLGYDSFEELATRNLEEEGYDPETPREGFKERLDRTGHLEGLEAMWTTKSGKRLFVRENAVAVRDDAGNVLFYDGTVEDITAQREAEAERRRLEMQLRQTQKLESIGTLASGIAHEINNPLTGMINYAELISRRVEDSRLKDFADAIMTEGARVAKIVRNLLSFSRQEKESHSPARIFDIFSATEALVGQLLKKDQIALDADVPDDLPSLKCRSQQIQQVLLNLLTNARDALNERYPDGHPDKIIGVTARQIADEGRNWIRVVVEDHGIGISKESLDRIFDPFFTTKPRDRGTGLGLSISYGIVRDHHGRLRVESEAGSFTRVILDLPIDNGWRLNAEESTEVNGGQGPHRR